jgi:predicted DNA-binding protein (MmcQ/YjbR family)
MNIEEFRDYCLAKKGATESFPFDEETLVFKVMGKMFALCALERIPTQVNLKCDPERSIELREEYDGLIFSGYHMSGLHWNTIFIEDRVPHSLLLELIDHSYQLVVNGLTKKIRMEWDNL